MAESVSTPKRGVKRDTARSVSDPSPGGRQHLSLVLLQDTVDVRAADWGLAVCESPLQRGSLGATRALPSVREGSLEGRERPWPLWAHRAHTRGGERTCFSVVRCEGCGVGWAARRREVSPWHLPCLKMLLSLMPGGRGAE